MSGDEHAGWNEPGQSYRPVTLYVNSDAPTQVSYEYIACQQARQGVMILSEFAGAAQSLNGSIVVNPWDSQQVADAIHEAVTMDTETRAENHRKLFKYVNKYSAAFWGSSFIREMGKLKQGDSDADVHAVLAQKKDEGPGSDVVGGQAPMLQVVVSPDA